MRKITLIYLEQSNEWHFMYEVNGKFCSDGILSKRPETFEYENVKAAAKGWLTININGLNLHYEYDEIYWR